MHGPLRTEAGDAGRAPARPASGAPAAARDEWRAGAVGTRAPRRPDLDPAGGRRSRSRRDRTARRRLTAGVGRHGGASHPASGSRPATASRSCTGMRCRPGSRRRRCDTAPLPRARMPRPVLAGRARRAHGRAGGEHRARGLGVVGPRERADDVRRFARLRPTEPSRPASAPSPDRANGPGAPFGGGGRCEPTAARWPASPHISGGDHTAASTRPPGRSTRRASASAAAGDAAYWKLLKPVTVSKLASANGSSSRSACSMRAPGTRRRAARACRPRRRARTVGAERRRHASASPAPQPTSSSRSPAPTPSASRPASKTGCRPGSIPSAQSSVRSLQRSPWAAPVRAAGSVVVGIGSSVRRGSRST